MVPSGAAGAGWSKPEEPQPQPQPQPEVRQSALTAGSNWASQNRSDSAGWLPPTREGPYAAGSAAAKGSFPVERHLNPEEYPSLAAVSREKPPTKKQQYEQQALQHQQVSLVHASCTSALTCHRSGSNAWQSSNDLLKGQAFVQSQKYHRLPIIWARSCCATIRSTCVREKGLLNACCSCTFASRMVS